MKPMNKGGKNETMALRVLIEDVRQLIYGKTDAEGGMIEVRLREGHRVKDKETRETEEEQA